MLGYGLLAAGIRDHNRRLVRSGLRGVSAALAWRTPSDVKDFATWSVAASYNLARTHLHHSRSLRRRLSRWRRWIAGRYTTHLFGSYENKSLVDAVAVLEARRSGIRSSLSSRRAVSTAVRLVNRRIPVRVSSFVLSDPDGSPIAYHALSSALYARAIQLLGRRASRRARAALRDLVGTGSLVTAPDGDFAVWGRSMQQKWTLTGLAAADAITARLGGSAPTTDRRLWSLGDRMLRRAADYGVGPAGEWIVPALRQDFLAGSRGIDGYARTTEYTGLSLVFANWAAAALPGRRALASIPADRNFAAQVGGSLARQSYVRHGDVWFAVRQQARNNLRYDFGLQALKRRSGGVWQDVIPLHPVGLGSAGPSLYARGRSFFATGTAMRVDRRTGVVELSGGFRRRHQWLRRGVRFRIAPDVCEAGAVSSASRPGVSVTVAAKAGDVLHFAAFFRRVPEHSSSYASWSNRAGGDPTRPLTEAVVFSLPMRIVRWRGGYHSAAEARLVLGSFSVTVPRDGAVRMTRC